MEPENSTTVVTSLGTFTLADYQSLSQQTFQMNDTPTYPINNNSWYSQASPSFADYQLLRAEIEQLKKQVATLQAAMDQELTKAISNKIYEAVKQELIDKANSV